MTLTLNFSGSSEVWCFKARKSQGLPLSWNSSQLSTWAHKFHYWIILVQKSTRTTNCGWGKWRQILKKISLVKKLVFRKTSREQLTWQISLLKSMISDVATSFVIFCSPVVTSNFPKIGFFLEINKRTVCNY